MGHVKAGVLTLACALGRSGITRGKREGDEATPAGTMRVLHGYYRSDRIGRPFCRVPLRPLTRDLGWCDDPKSAAYNRPGSLPMQATHEDMWRKDGLYDIILVLDFNIRPRRSGRGSAIFLHCAKASPATTAATCRGLNPTLGCVALRPEDLHRLLGRLARHPRVIVM